MEIKIEKHLIIFAKSLMLSQYATRVNQKSTSRPQLN